MTVALLHIELDHDEFVSIAIDVLESADSEIIVQED